MNTISAALRQEYERWCGQMPPQPPPEAGKVTIQDALKAHALLIDAFRSESAEGFGGVGPRSMALLASAIDRQYVGLGQTPKWKTVFEWAATTFFGMIKNHPFHDGNKRTGLLLALLQLHRSRRIPSTKQRDFEQLAVATAGSALRGFDERRYVPLVRKHGIPDADVHYIADRFRVWTRHEDREFYVITFSQLDRLLRRFGYRLANPNKNYIDIVKTEERRRFLFGPLVKVERKVLDIGFPGWKDQVGMTTVAKIRKATGLTTEQGVDSQVFFKELEPMQSFIDLYHGPLLRLADK